jgi:hypothetical protein
LVFEFLIFEEFHVEVALLSPLAAGDMPQPGRTQHQGGLAIREGPHHSGAPADLADNTLQGVVSPDAATMLTREVVIRQEGNED